MSHDDEVDLFPEFPLTTDSRMPVTWRQRAARRIFGDKAAEKGLWYPPADRRFSMRTKGTYANGFPMGAVIHSTEGRSKRGDTDAQNTITGTGIPGGHCYLCISSTGKVYQSFLLDRWGIHAGKSYHASLGYRLDNKLVGIEMCSAGIVRKQGNVYKPDWSESFTEAEVRYSAKVENVTEAGHYHRFSAAQERALIDLLLWLHRTRPDVFKLEHVLGHDEIATEGDQGSAGQHKLGRKQDPGAALSVYMAAFRSKLMAMAATS